MNRISTKRRSLGRQVLVLGVFSLGTTLASQVMAGCGQYDPEAGAPLMRPDAIPSNKAGYSAAVYRPGAEVLAYFVDDRGDRAAGIVGTWRFTFVSDGTAYPVSIPYGATVDFGTVQWHSDGTEFTISGGRAPSTGDVCMGSWEQTGPNTYKLKHIALAYVSSDSMPPAPHAVYLGPAIERQTITLNRARNAFEGHFTLDQYAADEVTLLEHISGTVTATRFSVD